jgi:hypothetical protein
MPIADTYVPLKTIGNGSTTDFSFNFPILAAANIRVYLEDVTTGVQTLQVAGTHFTLVFNDETPGGTVTMLSAPSSGYYVIRAREIPRTQENTYKTAAGFQATVVQAALEKLTAMVQDVYENILRSVKLPLGSSVTAVTLPTPEDDSLIAWDGTSGGMKNLAASDFIGPTGPQGATGPQGPQGVQGIQGVQGDPGTVASLASQAEAETGTENVKYSSPLRVAQAIAALGGGVKGDGTVGLVNLLQNGDFENWSAGTSVAPDYWIAGSVAATVTQQSSEVKEGSYSCQVNVSSGELVYQNLVGQKSLAYLKGRTLTFGCWAYATVANRVRIAINDGVSAVTYSTYHTGNSTWQWLTLTKTLSATASYVRPCLCVESAGGGYFDGAMCVEGASQFAFTPHPNDQHKFISHATITRDLSTATGDVAYTGLGFTPKAIIAFGGLASTSLISTGISGTDKVSWCAQLMGTAGTFNADTALIGGVISLSDYVLATVKSYDADGFTLTWTKTGSPTGTLYFSYLAIG